MNNQNLIGAKRHLSGTFFGESIANLDRDTLLAVIGCLQEQNDLWHAISGNPLSVCTEMRSTALLKT